MRPPIYFNFIFLLFLLKPFLPCGLPFASTAGPAVELYKINLPFQSSALLFQLNSFVFEEIAIL